MKNNDVAVEGDVGQVVAGNVVHEGARASSQLNNVITISTGQAVPPVRTITDLQRKRINAKVKEVMDVAGIERQLDVYSVVLTDFGIANIVDLPCEQFKAVMSMLDNWIVEERSGGGSLPTEQATIQGEDVISSLTSRIDQLRGTIRTLRIGVVSALAVAGSGLYLAIAQPTPVEARTTRSCLHDGKEHSVGSVIRMPDSGIYECAVSAADGGVPSWTVARNLGSAARRR